MPLDSSTAASLFTRLLSKSTVSAPSFFFFFFFSQSLQKASVFAASAPHKHCTNITSLPLLTTSLRSRWNLFRKNMYNNWVCLITFIMYNSLCIFALNWPTETRLCFITMPAMPYWLSKHAKYPFECLLCCLVFQTFILMDFGSFVFAISKKITHEANSSWLELFFQASFLPDYYKSLNTAFMTFYLQRKNSNTPSFKQHIHLSNLISWFLFL